MAGMTEGLTDTEIDALKAKLAGLREALLAQEAESEGSRAAVTLDQQSVGRLSRMDAIQQQAMAEAESRRRKSDLARIDAAFRRIEAGEYGWCDQCGEPIGRKRLGVDPMATRCVGCAE
jgi:DnaK suppressor protein